MADLTTATKTIRVMNAVAAGITDQNSSIVDMAGWVEIHNTSITVYEDTPLFTNSRAIRTDWMPHLSEELVTT